MTLALMVGAIGGLTTTPSAAAAHNDGIGFGFHTNEWNKIEKEVEADNLPHPTYTTTWANHGWDWLSGPNGELRTAQENNLIPVIHWYYWGDDYLWQKCIEEGCARELNEDDDDKPFTCKEKGIPYDDCPYTWHDWYDELDRLKSDISKELGVDSGPKREAIVTIQLEFNRNDIVNQGYRSTWNGYMEDHIESLQSMTDVDVRTIVGFGEWGYDLWDDFAGAVQKSSLLGTQFLKSELKHADSFDNGAQNTEDRLGRLWGKFGPDGSVWEAGEEGVESTFIYDWGLSTYGSSGDTQEHADIQARELDKLRSMSGHLRDAYHLEGFMFRMFDDTDRDWGFHGKAECCFGIRDIDKNPKESYGVVQSWMKQEAGVSTSFTTEVEAEDMVCTEGTEDSDPDASGGAFWNLWTTGHCDASIGGVSGDVELQVVAQGDPAEGVWPEMEAWIDGQKVANWTVNDDSWVTYNVSLSLDSGGHDLEVHFTNDYDGSNGDRNLWLDVVYLVSAGDEWSHEGENMDCTAGTNAPDSEASGEEFWNLWTNGHCDATISGVAGDLELHIVAIGDPADGVWPEMEAWIDGQEVGSWTVNSGDWTTYTASVSLPSGDHDLEIYFTNDYEGSDDDRNLWIDVAHVVPQEQDWSIEGEDMDCTDGTTAPDSEASGDEFWNLWTNGHCDATIPGISGDVGLHIRAQGDPAEGVWPEMEAWIDDQQVGAWTVDDDSWQTYATEVSLASGDNELEIRYTNDAYGSSGDRNLWIDLVTVTTNDPPLTIRDDDGEMDAWFDSDHDDDTAVKRLELPSDALDERSSAQLHVFARAAHCGGSGTPHSLLINGVEAETYSSCDRWSENDFEWSTFNVPLSELQAGATNSFEITDGNTWNDLDHHFALDTDTDEGRTDAEENRVDQPGELMWYLVIS